MTMKVSLVISTLNRVQTLERFLEHLDQQNYENFEVIIVDQNDDDRLIPLIDYYQDKFTILHIHSARGVSRGRNTGIKKISGDLVAFPDDDCWYEADLLARVVNLFTEHPELDVISGRTVDAKGHTSLGRFRLRSGLVTRRNVFNSGNTNSFFFQRKVVERINFDESLGPGAGSKWGSGEETDYLLNAMQMGFSLYYYNDLTVFHDNPIFGYDETSIQRGYSYGCGTGRVLKKHHYPLDLVLFKLMEQFAGMMISLLQMNGKRFRYHQATFKGRLTGWRSSVDEELQ